MTEEQFKNRCAEIIRENITFSGQLNDYVIHGALDAIWKLHNEQNLNKHGVMQAEASECAEGAAVASSAVAKGVSDGFCENVRCVNPKIRGCVYATDMNYENCKHFHKT